LGLVLEGWTPEIPSDALPLLKELITDCWCASPEGRPSAEELFKEISDNNFAIFGGVDPTEVRSYLSWCDRKERQRLVSIAPPIEASE
jgi:hypothetical protein